MSILIERFMEHEKTWLEYCDGIIEQMSVPIFRWKKRKAINEQQDIYTVKIKEEMEEIAGIIYKLEEEKDED